MTIGSIDIKTLKEWQAQNNVLLIDVREPAEWNAGHIEGAVHIPLGTISASVLPPAHGRKIVMQCRSGKRSMTACEIVTRQNPAIDAYNLEGGILAWEAAQHK